MNDLSQKVRHIIGVHLGLADDEVTEQMYLKDDLNADQLVLADIAVSLEESFHIEITQEELENMNTVGDIVTYVSENLNEL